MKSNPASPYPVRSAEKIEVIRTESVWGKGVKEDPIRIVTQYWSLDGRELAKVDTWTARQEEE